MAATGTTQLALSPRAAEGSRANRRLRRSGLVPGIIYGGDAEPQLFSVDGRILRNTLARAGAILEVSLDGAAMPVLVKTVQRHPVRGEAVHVDLLRVRMDETIQTTVTLELVGADSAPGVALQGGVLTQGAVELNIEALPGDIPDSLQLDVSSLEINGVALLSELSAPAGVRLLDDPETVLASLTPPTAEPVEEEIETETERVGDAAAQAQAQGDTAEEADQSAASDES